MTDKEFKEMVLRIYGEFKKQRLYGGKPSYLGDFILGLDFPGDWLVDDYDGYEPKNFQIIRDYHNGTKKVIAKEYPPVCKGIKRNRETFRAYDRKLYNSITRSKQTVYELAKCNKWTYFVTLTIDPKKFDRSDFKTFMKTFTKWLGNYSDRKLPEGKRIAYLLIPEIGKRGAWHLHGLLRGIPRRHLSLFVEGKHPQYLVDGGFLNWEAYADKFGFCWLDKVRSSEAAVRYSTKKILKSYKTQMRGLGERLYYCSKGLKRSVEIKRGYNLVPIVEYDFENGWALNGFMSSTT